MKISSLARITRRVYELNSRGSTLNLHGLRRREGLSERTRHGMRTTKMMEQERTKKKK